MSPYTRPIPVYNMDFIACPLHCHQPDLYSLLLYLMYALMLGVPSLHMCIFTFMQAHVDANKSFEILISYIIMKIPMLFETMELGNKRSNRTSNKLTNWNLHILIIATQTTSYAIIRKLRQYMSGEIEQYR